MRATPLILHVFGGITTGDYAEDLRELASQGTNAFMMLTVLLPSILGIGVHFIIGETGIKGFKSHLKLANFVVLLLLNYSNAATTLPQVCKNPDFDYLAFVFFTTTLLCCTAFGAAWLIGRQLQSDRSDLASLMFGLGMNNNGTGLVLAAATLSDHPTVLLPMIFYTLVQQVVAAIVDWKFFKSCDDRKVESS